METMASHLDSFKSSLLAFAQKYRAQIRSDPQFRAAFQKMCANIGVDPLGSTKGVWDMLGVGEFYWDLGVQVAEVCFVTREENGGWIGVHELHSKVEAMRVDKISTDDILKAVELLKILGSFKVLNLAPSNTIISTQSRELSPDVSSLLSLAAASGYITERDVEKIGWNNARWRVAIEEMVKDGICWIDAQASPMQYWIPAYVNM